MPGPVYLNATGVAAQANADDTGSGIASATCDPLETGAVGDHTVTCTATDNAGNTATATIHYLVEYRIVIVAPASGATVRTQQTVTVAIELTDANNVRIRDAAAVALLRPMCRVQMSATGVETVPPTCMKYEDHRFTSRIRLGSRSGTETITVTVSYPNTSATSEQSRTVSVTGR